MTSRNILYTNKTAVCYKSYETLSTENAECLTLMYVVHIITILLKKRITLVQKYKFHHEFYRNIGEIVLTELTAASVPRCYSGSAIRVT
jgi:hypothetical protein